MRMIVPVLLLIFPLAPKAQENKNLGLYQDSLQLLQTRLYRAKDDADKLKINSTFILTLEKALSEKSSFDFPFDSLKEIGRLTSPDKKFRLYNWNVPMKDGTHQYFGFLQAYNEKSKSYQLYRLTDKSAENKNPDNYSSDHTRWYGMLYYKIIVNKHKKKTYYTLLAWDGNDRLSTKKIIDVLVFDSRGFPKFGETVFEAGKKTAKRIVFEFSAQTSMSLRYDDKSGMIVFSHLAPPDPSLNGQPVYYGPDGSFDAFEFKKGKWIFKSDVDARNPETPFDKPSKSEKDRGYKDPGGGQPPKKN